MTCPKSLWSESKSHVKALYLNVYYKGYNYGWTSQWLSDKESACQCRSHRRLGFNPWVRKIPWRRTWKHTSVFLPVASHGQRSLVGYSPWGLKELDTTERLHLCLLHWQVGSLPLVPPGKLYRTGNSIQGSVMTYMGMESRKEWIYVYICLIHFAI